jgi:hypothetical protein
MHGSGRGFSRIGFVFQRVVEAFNKCWKLHHDEVASDAEPHGDDDPTPASHNLDGDGININGRIVVAKPATAMSSSIEI